MVYGTGIADIVFVFHGHSQANWEAITVSILDGCRLWGVRLGRLSVTFGYCGGSFGQGMLNMDRAIGEAFRSEH